MDLPGLLTHLQLPEKSAGWIRRLCAEGKIPHHKIGPRKGVRFYRPEIDRWLLDRGTPLEEIA